MRSNRLSTEAAFSGETPLNAPAITATSTKRRPTGAGSRPAAAPRDALPQDKAGSVTAVAERVRAVRRSRPAAAAINPGERGPVVSSMHSAAIAMSQNERPLVNAGPVTTATKRTRAILRPTAATTLHDNLRTDHAEPIPIAATANFRDIIPSSTRHQHAVRFLLPAAEAARREERPLSKAAPAVGERRQLTSTPSSSAPIPHANFSPEASPTLRDAPLLSG